MLMVILLLKFWCCWNFDAADAAADAASDVTGDAIDAWYEDDADNR